MWARPLTRTVFGPNHLISSVLWRERVVASGRVLPEPRAAAAPLAAGWTVPE